jgi:hypothetical protein
MDLENLFAVYARAFETVDPAGAAALYAYPAHITTDMGAEVRLTAIASPDAFVPMLRALMEKYRRDGVKRIVNVSTTVTELSSRMRWVAIHWRMLGLADLPLYDFDNVYVVGRFEQEWKICSALSPNELQRYRAFIGRG